MKTELPFQGFYNTIHGWYSEDSVTSWFQDDSGDVYDDFWENSNVDWFEVRKRYIKEFTENVFLRLGEIHSELKLNMEQVVALGKAAKLDSPREYNFANDAIILELPNEYAEKLLDLAVEHYLPQLQEFWKAHSTAYDGYCPFYCYQDFELDFQDRDLYGPTSYFTIQDIMRLILESDSEEWETYILEDYTFCGRLDCGDLANYTGVHANV